MKRLTIIVVGMLVMMGGFVPMVATEDVEAQTGMTFNPGIRDHLRSADSSDYDAALWGDGDFGINPSNPLAFDYGIGQTFNSGTGLYVVYRAFLSYDTSTIPDDFQVLEASLSIRTFTCPPLDFKVLAYNVDIGNTLDATKADFTTNGTFEGILLNSTNCVEDNIYTMNVLPENIDKGGLTQYKLITDKEGMAPTGFDLIALYKSYAILSITMRIGTSANITYNFTTTGRTPTNATVEYWDEDILASLETGFEDGIFGPAWTTFGSPLVTSSFAPFEGIYHAGASIGESGAGNHTFEAAINGTGLFNLTLSYYRKTQDIGGGAVSFIASWYNGTAWNELENFVGSSIYTQSTWALNSTADNNPDLIFRFNVTLTAGNPSNGGWIDNPQLISTTGFHIHSNTTIYPVEIIPWNETFEQIRYEIFIPEPHPTLLDWIHIHPTTGFIFQSHHPDTTNVTELGGGSLNITEVQFYDIYHHFWFLKEIDGGIGTNYSLTIYPYEIIEWNNTWDQIRFEVWIGNQSWAHMEVNDTFVYQSHQPGLNVTDMGGGLFNLTEPIIQNQYFALWFLREKSVTQTHLHIRLWDSRLGLGQPEWRWKTVINDGLAYDNSTAIWIYNLNDWPVIYSQNYTITVLDFFDNVLTNYSFTANAMDMDILIPINIYTLQVVNLMTIDTALIAIYFNATGDPFTQAVVANNVFKMPIRQGSYRFIITYLQWDNTTQTETVGNSYTYDLVIDADFNFYIGDSLIQITKIRVDGVVVDVNTIVTMTTPSVIIIPEDPCLVPTHQVYPGDELPIFLDPWYVITADIRTSDTDNLSAAATLNAGELDTTLMAGSIIFMSDILKVSAGNTSANMIINDTDTATEVLNTTAPAGAEYDIVLDYYANRGHALTVWVEEGAFSVTRQIRYRQSQRFNWEVRQGGHYFICTIQVNNTQAVRIMEPHVFVAFHNDTNPDLDRVEVFDQNNNIWLEKANAYGVDNTGVSFMFTNLSAGSQRSFQITYYGKNATLFGEAWIDPAQAPQWFNYNGKQMRYVFGTYVNNAQTEFEGVVKFSLDFTEAGNMDRGSIIVIDLNDDVELARHSHWRLTDSAIEITSNYVGQIDPGASLSIGVLYLRTDETATNILTDPIVLGLSLPWLLAMIAGFLIIAGLLVSRTGKFKDESKNWINTGFTVFMLLIGLVILILAVSGSS